MKRQKKLQEKCDAAQKAVDDYDKQRNGDTTVLQRLQDKYTRKNTHTHTHTHTHTPSCNPLKSSHQKKKKYIIYN